MSLILVIEDDPSIRTALIRSLEARGHAVRTAADAMAKLGGVGDKAIATPEAKKEVVNTISEDPTLTDPQKALLQAGLSENMTNGQIKALKEHGVNLKFH